MKKTVLFLFSFICTYAGWAQGPVLRNQNTDFSKGYFILNEDQFGTYNSSLNFLSDQKEFSYRVFAACNDGKTLGVTASYGQIYGDHMFFVCKQGARLTISDKKNLKIENQIEEIGAKSIDGRSGLGVDENKLYIGSTSGIFVYNISKKELSKLPIKGTDGPTKVNEKTTAPLSGEIGSMVRYGDRVFAVHRNHGLLVVDAQADTLITYLPIPQEESQKFGIGSVVLAKNGKLYLSLVLSDGGSAPSLLEVDPVTLKTSQINLPEEIPGPANSWYAWTPDAFFASKIDNTLYWTGGKGSWFAKNKIYKYDLGTQKAQQIIDLAEIGWEIYGCSLRENPLNGNLVMSLFKGWGKDNFAVAEYDKEGKHTLYTLKNHYWFPSLPIFPDEANPEIKPLPETQVEESKVAPIEIALLDYVSDTDSPEVAIWTQLVENSTPEVAQVKVKMNKLHIEPTGKKGETNIKIKYNSNGKIAFSTLTYKVTDNVAIQQIGEKENIRIIARDNQMEIIGLSGYHIGIYDLSGVCITQVRIRDAQEVVPVILPSGVYVIRANNGLAERSIKVLVP